MARQSHEVEALLKEIVDGEDRGVTIARNLVTAILGRFPDADDDPRFEELMHILASYEPGGGEYLFDEHQLAKECKWVLAQLET